MKKNLTLFSCAACWLFALSIQAQVIFSVRNEKLKIHTFTTLGVDHVRTQKNALVALSDSSFVVADLKELRIAIETWKSTHGGLLPTADSLYAMIALKQIAFSDLDWAKINKPSGALVGMGLGGALGAIVFTPHVTPLKTGPFLGTFLRTITIIIDTGIILTLTMAGAGIGALVQPSRTIYRKEMILFGKKIRKWRKYTIVAQLQKIYPSSPK